MKRIFVANDPTTLRIYPSLAKEIGFNESILLLQLDFWLQVSPHEKNGQKWTYQSVRDIQKKVFPFWSIATINRTIKSLIDQGLIIVGNFNVKKYDKTRWFTLNYNNITKLKSVIVKEIEQDLSSNDMEVDTGVDTRLNQNETGVLQNDTGLNQNETRSAQKETTIPETTSKTTLKNTTKDNNLFKPSFKESNKKHINNNLYSSKDSKEKSEFISGKEKQQPPPSYKPPNNLSPENIKKQRVLFEKFWTQYPRKVNKVGALAEWLKINPDEALFNQIMEGLENYIKYEWPNAELNFIVYPSTFLAQRRWEDKPGVQYPKPEKVWTTTEEEKDGLYDSHIKPFVSGILKDV